MRNFRVSSLYEHEHIGEFSALVYLLISRSLAKNCLLNGVTNILSSKWNYSRKALFRHLRTFRLFYYHSVLFPSFTEIFSISNEKNLG